jgi:peptide/nickel transport system substrate-binding protein
MRHIPRIAAAAAAAVMLAACSGTAPPAATSANTTFTYANNLTVMVSWDPATAYSNEVIAMNNIYEQLTRYDSTTKKVMPLLALSWTTAPNGLTWTFKLRSGVTFSDGHPMDAAAAKAALDRTIKLAGGAAYEWDAVKTIVAQDPTTLVFNLKYAAPLDLIASSAYSAYIYDITAATGNLAAWFEAGHTAGTGPYVVESYNKGQATELTLKENPTYWGGWQGNHYKSVVFQVVPQQTTAAQLLQSKQVTFVPRLSPSLFNSLASAPGIKTSQTPSFQNILAMFNTATGPLADPRVRQAVSQAIDYKGIVTALRGAVVQAQGVIPEGLLGFTTGVNQATNVATAQSLLKAAGYGPGGKQLSLTLTYASGTPEFDTIVTLLKSNLAQVGVTLNAKALAWETQWAIGKSQDTTKRQDIFLFYWYPDYADPFSWFTNLYHSASPVYFNLSYWQDSAVDATIDGLQAVTATNRDQAQQQYVQLQQVISAQAVSPVLGVENYQRAYLTTVGGYVDNPSYSNVVFVHDVTPQG